MSGIAQYAQRFEQPSETFRYAVHGGVDCTRASGSIHCSVGTRRIMHALARQRLVDRLSQLARMPDAKKHVDITHLLPRSVPNRCDRHPITTTALQLPLFLYSSASQMASIDSCLALSMNPHVLTTITSARD